jgi:hypothetical protein
MLMDITVITTMNIRVISSFLGGLLGTFYKKYKNKVLQ